MLLIALLVVATLGGAAWALRGGSDSAQPAAADFVSVERRFASTAAAVHETPVVVQTYFDIDRFNLEVAIHADEMGRMIAEFDRIAHEEEGDAARIAQGAVITSQDALRAVGHFRDAIPWSNDLSDALKALADLDAFVGQLDVMVERWRQL